MLKVVMQQQILLWVLTDDDNEGTPFDLLTLVVSLFSSTGLASDEPANCAFTF